MWPSDVYENGRDGPLHARAFAIARACLGEDTAFDFDMTIWKNAQSQTDTPWHQDQAYWPKGMRDKRAMTVWAALDDATMDNGAMWYVDRSHLCEEIHPHRPASEGSHVLMTDALSESTPGATCVPIPAGSCVFWSGKTAHYSRGNSTATKRRPSPAIFGQRAWSNGNAITASTICAGAGQLATTHTSQTSE